MKSRVLTVVLITICVTLLLSSISNKFWNQESKEEKNLTNQLAITNSTTINEISQAYNLHPSALKSGFGLSSPADKFKTISELGISADKAKDIVNKLSAITQEESSKNWIKIRIKFIGWITMLIIVFVLMKNNSINHSKRLLLYALSIIIFGIILGSDPSPMGTVKDAIVLWGKDRVVFLPRMIALSVFLLMVILANKFICSWGCQLGVLQDFLFRLNRTSDDKKSIIKQYKLPFLITNSIRILFFIAIVICSIAFALDIVEPIDPFKIYNPTKLSIIGYAFSGIILFASVFVYRPWCHLFCPFGLVGWFAERLSFYKIKVNYNTCIACEACAKACPSNVMDAILKQDKQIPDCFSCGTCQNICPTNSISFRSGKRTTPPKYKFRK